MSASWMRALRNAVLPRVFGSARYGGTLGIYGVPNAGKTTLANRIARQWLNEEIGIASPTPHETRAIQRKDGIILESPGARLRMNIADTPGLAATVSATELAAYCQMDPAEAKRRAREATEGILQAIEFLQSVDGMILVVDATREPAAQTHATLIAHVRARKIPLLVVANKVDLAAARPLLVARAFAPYTVVPVSAQTGVGLGDFYARMVDVFG